MEHAQTGCYALQAAVGWQLRIDVFRMFPWKESYAQRRQKRQRREESKESRGIRILALASLWAQRVSGRCKREGAVSLAVQKPQLGTRALLRPNPMA